MPNRTPHEPKHPADNGAGGRNHNRFREITDDGHMLRSREGGPEPLPFGAEAIQTDNGIDFGSQFHWHLLDKDICHVHLIEYLCIAVMAFIKILLIYSCSLQSERPTIPLVFVR